MNLRTEARHLLEDNEISIYNEEDVYGLGMWHGDRPDPTPKPKNYELHRVIYNMIPPRLKREYTKGYLYNRFGLDLCKDYEAGFRARAVFRKNEVYMNRPSHRILKEIKPEIELLNYIEGFYITRYDDIVSFAHHVTDGYPELRSETVRRIDEKYREAKRMYGTVRLDTRRLGRRVAPRPVNRERLDSMFNI